MAERWTVHKFGGTSLADAAAYRRVARLVEPPAGRRTAIVVSAMAGVTDDLLALGAMAAERDAAWSTRLRDVRRRQAETIGELVDGDAGAALAGLLDADVNDIEDLLRAGWLLRSQTVAQRDLVSGYGELWSSRLLAAHLVASGRSARWVDAREVLTIEPGELAPVVRWEQSARALAGMLAVGDEATLVVPGYVASGPDGLPTTLGRNGSDYSASIVAALLEAEQITIWTDVDGVLSADPRKVPAAVVTERLSYDEAMELAYFGAKVIHPSTMAPAVRHGIPIRIRNTFRPEAVGTRIDATGTATASEHPVKGIATIDGLSLMNLEGTGMIGVPGVSERLFGALADASVSVVMISQGSSEHSICFAIPTAQAALARRAVERAFFAEMHQGHVQALDVVDDCSILAAVGDEMAGRPGIAATFFDALGAAGVNVRAIAQGSSERNISAVIDTARATRAVRAVHAGFYLSDRTLSVGVIGAGNVGATLLDQLAARAAALRDELHVDLRVRGIVGRTRMLLDDDGVALDGWRDQLEDRAVAADLDRFVEHVLTESIPHAVIVDCTADDAIAERYGAWIARGLHVVTPNKKANTGSLERWDALRRATREAGRHYLYETTVGAGLPVVQTLRDLIRTGDEVLGIEGVLSGTLSYLFNSFDGERPFSALVREARDQGFTEPDPRDDLSGTDVARKVLILAREMGLRLSLDELEVDSLVPAGLDGVEIATFLDRLAEHDDEMERRLNEARAAGEVLRFVGTVAPGGVSSVRLRRYPADHAFARIRLTDNIVQFRTRRYDENPLVVQGPGAGPAVTAGGVFADLLRLATYLGAAS